MKLNQRGGFIALISAVVISVVLFLVISTTSLTGFYGRFNVLGSEYKERSSALADACVDELLLKLANDSSYVGPETVSIDSDQCQIVSSSGSNPRTFNIQAIYQNSYTNLEVVIDIYTMAISSWLEKPN